MLDAAQIMTTQVISTGPDLPILEAAILLIKHKISGLPVVDADNGLCGILSEKDILKLLVEPETKDKVVGDYMTKKVLSFKETDSVVDICLFLDQKNVRRVPIVDGQNKLKGIISRRDIIKQMLFLRGLKV